MRLKQGVTKTTLGKGKSVTKTVHQQRCWANVSDHCVFFPSQAKVDVMIAVVESTGTRSYRGRCDDVKPRLAARAIDHPNEALR